MFSSFKDTCRELFLNRGDRTLRNQLLLSQESPRLWYLLGYRACTKHSESVTNDHVVTPPPVACRSLLLILVFVILPSILPSTSKQIRMGSPVILGFCIAVITSFAMSKRRSPRNIWSMHSYIDRALYRESREIWKVLFPNSGGEVIYSALEEFILIFLPVTVYQALGKEGFHFPYPPPRMS